MTEHERDELAATAAAEAEAPGENPDVEAPAADTAAEPALDDPPAPDLATFAEQAAKAAEYYDRLARLQAEFDNYRKRMQREQETFVKYAGERFVQPMLPVLDNFTRALAAIPADDNTQAWRQGIEMIQKQLIELLEKEGVTAVTADPGTPFDPHQHEAVLHEDSDEFDDGHIIDELQRGYKLHDRLLRPSLVRVARRG